MSVIKTRASLHEPMIRHFQITDQGIALGDQFEATQPVN
jgi:hypothetical protein